MNWDDPTYGRPISDFIKTDKPKLIDCGELIEVDGEYVPADK